MLFKQSWTFFQTRQPKTQTNLQKEVEAEVDLLDEAVIKAEVVVEEGLMQTKMGQTSKKAAIILICNATSAKGMDI